jgi:hypothetical protein
VTRNNVILPGHKKLINRFGLPRRKKGPEKLHNDLRGEVKKHNFTIRFIRIFVSNYKFVIKNFRNNDLVDFENNLELQVCDMIRFNFLEVSRGDYNFQPQSNSQGMQM